MCIPQSPMSLPVSQQVIDMVQVLLGDLGLSESVVRVCTVPSRGVDRGETRWNSFGAWPSMGAGAMSVWFTTVSPSI